MSGGDAASLRRRATAVGVFAIVLWATMAPLTALTRGIPPFETLAVTFATAFVGSTAVLALRGRRTLARLRQPARVWLLGFFGIFGYHALYFFALKAAPIAEASLVNNLWPLLIVLFSAPVTGDPLRRRHLAGALLGLAGTAVIVLQRADTGGTAPLAGYTAALGCAFVWSGYSVLNRRIAEVPSDVIGVVCGMAALAGLGVHLVAERWSAPTASQWTALAAMGAGPAGLAFFAWDHGTKRGILPLLGALAYVSPLLSTLALVLMGRAAASLSLAAAAALVVGGAAVAALPWRGGAGATLPSPP